MPDPSRRWEAIRALAEGALPTHDLLAAACGIYKSNISRRAKLDGWMMLDFRRRKVRDAHAALIELADRAPGRAAAGGGGEGELAGRAPGRAAAAGGRKGQDDGD